MPTKNRNREGLERDRFWYKTGVIYEVHVRAFYDTDGNGTGDFRGLTEKLGYIKDLGVTAVWLLPFYPSPLKDDGYDIADYCNVHRIYGTLADFKTFLREAHRRGLRVITELVLNHTSDQHAWFQRARRAAPGSRWRNFYVWSDTPAKYEEARIIFKDVEISNWTWDHVAKAYYWHRFFSHQPDLNFDNSEVHEAIIKVVDFWLDLGVDGLRLDAVPYLYEREGTDCENLPETHVFLKKLRAHVDAKYEDRMLLGEANQWPEDATAYFGQGQGDECNMAFHFPLMPRLFMAARMEDRQPITDILEQTPPIPETCQWALFLRNHDELTLEMVTDEERDYMYRMYAQIHQARLNLGIRRRLAPLLGNDRKRIELLNALLCSLPGTPVLYYGDEIGLGENIYLGDRNGVRTPMQWSSDKNAGFSRANPQSLYLPIILDPAYHYEAINVEAQLANPHSLLWWMRRMLALRKRWRALGRGQCEFLHPENRKILSYILRHDEETLLVVANLSRFAQPVDLDLSRFEHQVPIELFGQLPFPVITDRPWFLSLGPHSFYWFSIESKRVPAQVAPPKTPESLPALAVKGAWKDIVTGGGHTVLEKALPDFLNRQPWFGGTRRTIKSVSIRETVSVPLPNGDEAFLTLVLVEYVEGDSESYSLPLALADGGEAAKLLETFPQYSIAELSAGKPAQSGILYDAFASADFCKALLELISHRRRLKGLHGEAEATRTQALRRVLGNGSLPEPAAGRIEHRNSSIVFGDKLILKLFRRLEPGANPEIELGGFLAAQGFSGAPPLAGAIEYQAGSVPSIALATLHEFVSNAIDARTHALDALGRYYDRVITWVAQERRAPHSAEPLKLLEHDIPAEVSESIGSYVESARLLGLRTAEMHLALASDSSKTELAPEAMTALYLRGVFQSMRSLALKNLALLGKHGRALPPKLAPLAERVVQLQSEILERFRQFSERRSAGKRLRIHGDCHLRHVLWSGKDFVFVDFEGNPGLPIGERCIKRSPLREVACMLRSFHHAAYDGLFAHARRGSISEENLPKFEPWVQFWNRWITVAFLKAYLPLLTKSDLLPSNEIDLREMLQTYLLYQMIAELGDPLQGGEARLTSTLQGIVHLIEQSHRT